MNEPRYEYKTVMVPKPSAKWTGGLDYRKRDRELGKYGAQGWEVVQFRATFGHKEQVELRRMLPRTPADPNVPTPQAPDETHSSSSIDQLAKLAELLDRDLITRDEFDRQKQRILESPNESTRPRSSGLYAVVLDDPGAGVTRIRVITAIRSLTGMAFKPAATVADSTPSTFLSGVDHATAAQAQETLAGLGATVRIVSLK
ncbi:ribosomal protein L7/L12 [Glycomyces sp. L485]|uniref:ribosomal protein L7/L12 n=1 Tax=Glycomyces sp. L485 TaxID=2909235 RepID=UPI001F4A97BE|nr:ribosomal protein L7/L12 [Glycomyces sp. L485]MCH7232275.1 ribosomal protein L7/L12 [Glycomyces sp. L485]